MGDLEVCVLGWGATEADAVCSLFPSERTKEVQSRINPIQRRVERSKQYVQASKLP
jgi:hypothetical protein